MIVKKGFCAIFILCTILYAKTPIPEQQIWRTLVLPKGSWYDQIGVHLFDLQYDIDTKMTRYGSNLPGVWNSAVLYYPEFSINNRISLAAFPLPYVRVLLTSNPLLNENNHSKVIQASVEGGINSFAFVKGADPFLAASARGTVKKPITDKIWYNGSLGYFEYFRVGHRAYGKYGDFSSYFGYQLTDKWDIQAGYNGTVRITSVPLGLYSTFSILGHYSINSCISIWAGSGITKHHNIELPVVGGIELFW